MSGRPKSGQNRPPSQAGQAAPQERIDNKKNGVPQDALKQAVFDKVPTAKKVFTQLDKDKDKKLSKEEFIKGILDLLEGHLGEDQENVSQEAVLALWKQTDINLDGFISFEEFKDRFCEDPTRNFFVRQELLPLIEEHRLVLAGVRDYIFQMYDNSEEGREKRRGDEAWAKLGFDDTTKFKPSVFNNLCEMFADEERAEATSKGQEIPPWVKVFEGMQKQDLATLYAEVELKNNGTVHLTRYDKRLGKVVELPERYTLNYKRRLNMEVKHKGKKGAPATAKPSSSKPATREKTPGGTGKKKKQDKPVVLKTISEPLLPEWLQHEMFTHIEAVNKPKVLRAAPAIKNWNITEQEKWGLEHGDGSECLIFLTDTFDIKAKVRGEDKDVIIFCSFQTELNGLHTFEWLYHAKIYLDKKEDVAKIDARPVQMFKSGGPYKLPRSSKPDFKNWTKHVPVPGIFNSSVQTKDSFL